MEPRSYPTADGAFEIRFGAGTSRDGHPNCVEPDGRFLPAGHVHRDGSGYAEIAALQGAGGTVGSVAHGTYVLILVTPPFPR